MPIEGVGAGRSIPSINNERVSRSFLPRVLQRICNSNSAAKPSPLSPDRPGASSQPAATLRGMVEATFSSYGMANVQHQFEVCEGDACLRPLAASGGKRADAHASGLQHALDVGGGMPRELMAGLANERAGADLATAGFVLQAANKRAHEGQEVDTGAVEKALKTVVEKLNAPDLARVGRGYYDGTRASKKVIDAFKKLTTETEKLTDRMGGIECVLQDIAATQVHDRLLQQISERYPFTVGQRGEWLGLKDEEGYTLSPADFLHRGAAAQLQARCDTLSSLGTFDQLQWKSHELLKLVDLILDLEGGPEDPPTEPKMAPKGAPLNSPGLGTGHGPGPGPGANWNNNSSTGGSVTISPGAFQSSGGSEAAMLKALEVIDRMDKRKTSAFSEALQAIYNLSVAANGKKMGIHGQGHTHVKFPTGGLKSDDFSDGSESDSVIGSRRNLPHGGSKSNRKEWSPENRRIHSDRQSLDGTGRGGRDPVGIGSRTFGLPSPMLNPTPDYNNRKGLDGAGRDRGNLDGGKATTFSIPRPVLIPTPDYNDQQSLDGAGGGRGDLGGGQTAAFGIPRPTAIPLPDRNERQGLDGVNLGGRDLNAFGPAISSPSSESGDDNYQGVVNAGDPQDRRLSGSLGGGTTSALEDKFRSLRAKRAGEAEGHWEKFDNEKRLIYGGRVIDSRPSFWLGATMGIGTSPIDNRTRKKFTNIHPQFTGTIPNRPSRGEPLSRHLGGSDTPYVGSPMRGSMYQRFHFEPAETEEGPLDGSSSVADPGA